MDIISTAAADFLAVCAGFSAVALAVSWLIRAVKAVRKPNQIQNERLEALEKRYEENNEKLARDLERLEALEEGNRVTQRALLALLKHGIDGNDVDAMKKAQTELQEFLIER